MKKKAMEKSGILGRDNLSIMFVVLLIILIIGGALLALGGVAFYVFFIGDATADTGFDDCKPGTPETDKCCCWIDSHVHDLGRTYNNALIEVEYKTGGYNGCDATVTIDSSVDKDSWNELSRLQTITSDDPPGSGLWVTKSTQARLGSGRFVRVTVTRPCYNDYSSARVIG